MTASPVLAADEEAPAPARADQSGCCGKYPMSIFRTIKTAKVMPVGGFHACVKGVYYEADEKLDAAGHHHSFSGENEKLTASLVLRYGWLDGHHVGLVVPHVSNNFSVGATDVDSNGLGNVAVFDKWNFLKETDTLPGLAAELRYIAPSGDTARKLGTDDYSWRAALIASKAWPLVNVHANVAQTTVEGRDADKFEAMCAVVSNMHPKIQPAIEYDYTYTNSKGKSHDLVPGVIWKFCPGWCLKTAAVINLDSTTTYRDKAGVIASVSRSF
jgi:hypothetical protein